MFYNKKKAMKISLKKKSWDRKSSTKSKAINCKPLVKLKQLIFHGQTTRLEFDFLAVNR